MPSGRHGPALALAALSVITTALGAQEHAPLPDKLIAATTVYIANDSGDLKAYDNFYKELKNWGRFKIVASREQADIVMELGTTSGSQVVSGTGSFATVTPVPALQLRILEGKTGEVLWTDVTDKWMSSGHAPSKLVANLKKRLPPK